MSSAEIAVPDGTATVIVQGEVDIATESGLRLALAEAFADWPSQLVVDSAATLLDCSGIWAIAAAGRRATADCQIVIRSPAPVARQVTGLTDWIRRA